MRNHRTFRKVSHTHRKLHEGEHRFEHWYVDNQVYFITARCRERYPAFGSEDAKGSCPDPIRVPTRTYSFAA